MAIYIMNMILLIVYAVFFNYTKSKKVKKGIFVLAIIQIILILGLREVGKVGKDWGYYEKYYNWQLDWNFSQILNYDRYELGFKLLTKVITLIINNTQFYIFVIAVISIVPIAYIIYKYSKMPFLSLIIYVALDFYAFNFAGLRQGIAMALIFFSYKYIVENKTFKYLFCILLATLFHTSAIVFLPVYFIRKIKINKINIAIFVILAIIIYALKSQIFAFINTFFYDNYSSTITDSGNWMILCILILTVCYIFYKPLVKNNINTQKLYIITTIGCMCMLFSSIASDTLRIANYFYIFIILLIPEVLNCLKDRFTKNVLTSLTILVFFVIGIYLLNVDSYSIIPYKFFL